MHNFIKILKKKSRDKASFTIFSEFESRQRLGQSKMTFDNLLGYIFQYQYVCKMLSQYSSQFYRTGPFSLFQNLELGKASIDKKCHFAIDWARSCQYQFLRKSLSKYSIQFNR